MKKYSVYMCVIYILFLLCSSKVWGLQYRTTSLETLSGTISSSATGINNSGQIVGYMQYRVDDTECRHAVLWQEGSATDLTPIGDWTTTSYSAVGINNNSQVLVDCSYYSGPSGGINAYVWENNSLQALPRPAGYDYSYSGAINDSGQIAGSLNSWPGANINAVLWQNGVAQELGSGWASDINEDGVIVGWILDSRDKAHVTIWQNGASSDLGLGKGVGINNNSQVIFNSSGHFCIWQDGNKLDLGSGTATAINNRGEVVGYSSNQAFIWTNGIMQELAPLPGDSYSQAMAINDLGQVVGYSYTNSCLHAVIWQPVPEPSSILALLCGLSGFGWIARKYRK